MVPGFFDLAPPAVFDTVRVTSRPYVKYPGESGQPATLCKSASSGKPEDGARLSHLNHLVQGRSMRIATAEDATFSFPAQQS